PSGPPGSWGAASRPPCRPSAQCTLCRARTARRPGRGCGLPAAGRRRRRFPPSRRCPRGRRLSRAPSSSSASVLFLQRVDERADLEVLVLVALPQVQELLGRLGVALHRERVQGLLPVLAVELALGDAQPLLALVRLVAGAGAALAQAAQVLGARLADDQGLRLALKVAVDLPLLAEVVEQP